MTTTGEAKKQIGGRRQGSGRKALPPERRKQRVQAYVEPAVAEWIEQEGGNKFAAKLLIKAHADSSSSDSLIV